METVEWQLSQNDRVNEPNDITEQPIAAQLAEYVGVDSVRNNK